MFAIVHCFAMTPNNKTINFVMIDNQEPRLENLPLEHFVSYWFAMCVDACFSGTTNLSGGLLYVTHAYGYNTTIIFQSLFVGVWWAHVLVGITRFKNDDDTMSMDLITSICLVEVAVSTFAKSVAFSLGIGQRVCEGSWGAGVSTCVSLTDCLPRSRV